MSLSELSMLVTIERAVTELYGKRTRFNGFISVDLPTAVQTFDAAFVWSRTSEKGRIFVDSNASICILSMTIDRP